MAPQRRLELEHGLFPRCCLLYRATLLLSQAPRLSRLACLCDRILPPLSGSLARAIIDEVHCNRRLCSHVRASQRRQRAGRACWLLRSMNVSPANQVLPTHTLPPSHSVAIAANLSLLGSPADRSSTPLVQVVTEVERDDRETRPPWPRTHGAHTTPALAAVTRFAYKQLYDEKRHFHCRMACSTADTKEAQNNMIIPTHTNHDRRLIQ